MLDLTETGLVDWTREVTSQVRRHTYSHVCDVFMNFGNTTCRVNWLFIEVTSLVLHGLLALAVN